MKYILTLLLTLSLFACKNSKKEAPEKKNRIITETSKTTSITTDTTQTAISATQTWNASTTIGEATLWRNKKAENSSEWKEILVTNVFGFQKDVPLGSIVQVIPLSKKVPVLGLKVTETTKRDGFEETEDDDWFEVELEEIKNKQYHSFKGPKERSDEYPLDLLVVYPPIKNCTLLENRNFKTTDLPKNVFNEIIKGALDFDNDELPDAIVCKFCCNDKSSATDCEYFCGEVYIKVDGKWILINTSQPA